MFTSPSRVMARAPRFSRTQAPLSAHPHRQPSTPSPALAAPNRLSKPAETHPNRHNAPANPPPPAAPHPPLRIRAHVRPLLPRLPRPPHPRRPTMPAQHLDTLGARQPDVALRRLEDTAGTEQPAGAGDEGAVVGEEAVRWVQEREEEEGQVRVYHLQQESEAQAEVCCVFSSILLLGMGRGASSVEECDAEMLCGAVLMTGKNRQG